MRIHTAFILYYVYGALALLASDAMAKNFTVFTPQVDAALQNAPEELWDAFAGIGIVVGTVFAFAGARMLRTAAFFFGTFGGALLAAVVLALIGDVESQIWLPVVLGVAVICGIITSCIVRLARLAMFIVLGVALSGIFVQYFLSYIEDLPAWVLYMLIAIFVVIAAFLTWKAYSFMMKFATSFIGGFIVLVCTARLTRGPISLAGMWVDPDFLVACVDMTCWGPFIAGGGVCVLGLLYQLRFKRRSSGGKTDKKTKRELEASEKARRKERERFEQRVEEIRRLADQEIAQATAASRQAVSSAQEEREALLQQTRALEEERARLQQARQQLDQQHRVVEAEYVHYTGNIAELPVATPAARSGASAAATTGNNAGRRNLMKRPQRPPRPTRPASRPPPPTPDGWGGGARPWNKCATHQVGYDVCGCTNPRSKEQVMAELERLKQEKELFERQQRELEMRNDELRVRLKMAEEAAVAAATEASLAQQRAALEVMKSAEVEQRLGRERLELERLLMEAEREKIEARTELDNLQQARRIDSHAPNRAQSTVIDGSLLAQSKVSAVSDEEKNTNGERATVVPPPPLDAAAEAELALDEEELRLKERMAQAEGLEEVLRREIEILDKQPVRVLTEANLISRMEQEEAESAATAAAAVSTTSPSIVKRMSALQLLPSVPIRSPDGFSGSKQNHSKFASKWTSVERKYSMENPKAARAAAAAAAASSDTAIPTTSLGATVKTTSSAANLSPLSSKSAKAVVDANQNGEAEENELEPVRDLFADFMSLLGKALQMFLEVSVFIIATIGWAIGKCADAARDAHMEHQEKQLRMNSQRKSQFRASDVKQRFSSPVRVEGAAASQV